MTSPSLIPIASGAVDADLLRALASINRKALERFITVAIDVLDTIDPDPDLEEDDPCGQIDEDGVNTVTPGNACYGVSYDGAGCIISDDDIDEVYRPLGRTVAGLAERQYRRDAIAEKRKHDFDDLAMVRRAIRKLERRNGTVAAH